MDNRQWTKKVLDYMQSRIYLEEREDIEQELLKMLENEEKGFTFNRENILTCLNGKTELEKHLIQFLENELEKKRVKSNCNGHEIFHSYSEYERENKSDRQVYFVLDLHVEETKPVVVTLPGYFIRELTKKYKKKNVAIDYWNRRFTKEELDDAVAFFMEHFFETFQSFFKSIHHDIELELIASEQDECDIECYMPQGEMLNIYGNVSFDYGDGDTVGETIYIMIPYQSIKRFI